MAKSEEWKKTIFRNKSMKQSSMRIINNVHLFRWFRVDALCTAKQRKKDRILKCIKSSRATWSFKSKPVRTDIRCEVLFCFISAH